MYEELSAYYVNGYGMLSVMIIPEGYEPSFFAVEGIDDETLEFVLIRLA
jgi:hypothetical protein